MTIPVLFGLLLGCLLVQPFVDLIFELAQSRPALQSMDERTGFEHTREIVSQVLAAAWFFALGAALGSFLNVVVYRMPKGVSITGSSRCPYCATAIRFRDNIPVFGWLLLGGRCRTCRLPISPRYPIVEFVTAMVFVLLLFVETLSGGANLPVRTPNLQTGFIWIVFDTKWDLIRLYGYHAFLLWTLLGISLIQWDAEKVPMKLVLLAGAVGLILPAIWPDVQPVEWWGTRPAWPVQFVWLERLDTGVLGLLCGAALGTALAAVLRREQANGPTASGPRPAAGIALGLVGLFLGWQAAISTTAISVLLRLVAAFAVFAFPRVDRVPFLMYLFAATVLQICIWRPLAELTWWPEPHRHLAVVVIACIAVSLVAWLTHSLPRDDSGATRG